MSYPINLLSISMLVDAHRLIEFAICVIFVFIYTHLTCWNQWNGAKSRFWIQISMGSIMWYSFRKLIIWGGCKHHCSHNYIYWSTKLRSSCSLSLTWFFISFFATLSLPKGVQGDISHQGPLSEHNTNQTQLLRWRSNRKSVKDISLFTLLTKNEVCKFSFFLVLLFV